MVVASVHGKVPSNRPVMALLGDTVTLYAVAVVGRGASTRYYSDAPSLTLRNRRISRRKIRPLAQLGSVRFGWYQVEPQPHHVETAPPNAGNPAYSNAILFGARHGRWLGYDTLEYIRRPIRHAIQRATGSTLKVKRTFPSHAKVDVNAGLGTMRYGVELRTATYSLTSENSPDTVARGISSSVMRVSFRSGNDLVGYLGAYFNVPNVFGSAGGIGRGHQTDRFQGADCADVIIGAARQAGLDLPYTSVSALHRYARPVSVLLRLTHSGIYYVEGSEKGKRADLPLGSAIRRGDIMLINYEGFAGSPRAWDHVAVVGAAKTTRGSFSGKTPILHMGYLYGLTRTAAQNEGPAVIQFLRLKKKYQRRLAHLQRKNRRP